jgi:hypothetical protein
MAEMLRKNEKIQKTGVDQGILIRRKRGQTAFERDNDLSMSLPHYIL